MSTPSQVEPVETAWPSKTLGELYVRRASVDPAMHSDESFDLFSVPAYERRVPDELTGSEIGSSKVTVEPGDTLLCRIVPHIRRAWVVPPGGGPRQIASGEWMVLRHPDVDSGFLRQLLLSDPFHDKFMSTVAGVGGSLMRARPAHAASIRIPLPPLPEQRRIADILDRADDLRAKRRRALSLLDELTARFVSQLGIDHEWPIRALQEVAATQGGLTVNRKRIGLPQEVDYLRVANVARGSIDLSEVKKIGITDAELERVSLRDGDLLVVEGHGNELEVGRTARWRGSGSMVHQNHLIRVRPYPGVLDSVYAEHFFNSQVARSYFRSVSKTTSGLNTINMSNVKGLPVQVPPFDVQFAFSEKAQQVDELRQLHRAELAKLDELFASLQHRAFQGEL